MAVTYSEGLDHPAYAKDKECPTAWIPSSCAGRGVASHCCSTIALKTGMSKKPLPLCKGDDQYGKRQLEREQDNVLFMSYAEEL